MKKLVKGLIVVALALGTSASIASVDHNNVEASGYTTRSASYNWYSLAHTVRAWFTLHGVGYSYPNSGKVTSAWITYGTVPLNTISGVKHWTYPTPRGTHLMGQATDTSKVDLLWANIPIRTITGTVGVQF